MNNIISVILAAGKGTRMKSDLPKVLFKVGGKALVEYCVATAKKLNPQKIIVVVGYKKEMVMDALGAEVEYAIQEEQLGTGHALMQARDQIADFYGYILVSNGDMPFISKEMFEDLYQKCKSEDASAALLTVETDNYPSWGRIVRNGNNNVKKIVEAKDADEEELKIREKNLGVYCFKAEDLFNAIEKIKSENAQEEYYLTDVIEIMEKDGKKVDSVVTRDYKSIVGINTPDELKKAKEILKARNENY